MFHPFSSDEIANVQLPEHFTYPFHYKPHPLCRMAAQKLQCYLTTQKGLEDWRIQGKMFGVLIVSNSNGEIGFLAAFSGLLAGTYHHDYFVPPIYDLLSADGFFKLEESKIDSMNVQIEDMKRNLLPLENEILQQISLLQNSAERELRSAKEYMDSAKIRRDQCRKQGGLTEMDLSALIKESQYLKAEYKRLKQKWNDRIVEKQNELSTIRKPIELAEKQRKIASLNLQLRLFEQFILHNALGETCTLSEIFRHTSQKIPPAGAGECAAPKLLQYAYINHLRPLAMAEFWWGKSPISEVRIQGYYYPSCKNKCGPILAFMLKGLDVEPNPLLKEKTSSDGIRIVYEDECLLIVDKPSGLLSVPGKDSLPSAYRFVKDRYPLATGPLLVHRIDMDTSGLLLVAKSKEVHELLQKQFEKRQIKKRYIALLDGELPCDYPLKGLIKLPLCPDYDNRPCQIVDFERGKVAVTRYEVLNKEYKVVDGVNRVYTKVAFYPQTGRTHQLRVHSAHPMGLNCPILGDSLYGQPSDRLYLHAEKMEFRHPSTGITVRFEQSAPF